jgi:external thioesterase TEII
VIQRGAPQIRVEQRDRGVQLLRMGAKGGAPRLICFPAAGAAATSFRGLGSALPESWELIAIDPPGHGFNRGPLLDDIEAMVSAYRAALEPDLREPCFLFGHSLGGLVAYRLAAQLEQESRPPKGLFVCTLKGPRRVVDETWSVLDDDALIARIDRIEGVPRPFRQNLEDFKPFLPAIRADFRALERYLHVAGPKLALPMWIFAAERDPFVAPERAREWLETGDHAVFELLPGGHFVLDAHASEVARRVVERVRAIDPSSG